jgi:hypothetical protein
MRLRRRAGGLLLGLYPEAWRARYGAEMAALIDEDPPGLAGLGSLLLGAGDAHLHPLSSSRCGVSPEARMRLSIGGAFSAWIALSLIGAGFQKATEEPAFSVAAHHHPALAIARDAVLAGAVLGAAAVALGGLPLLWLALRRAGAEHDRRLAGLLLLPAASVLGFLALTRLLLLTAPARDGGFPVAFIVSTALPWMLGALACAATCALVPRAVLRRIEAPPAILARASTATVALAGAMFAVSTGLVLYAVALGARSSALFAQGTGPIGAPTGAMLATGALGAALLTGAGLLSAGRARRARTGTST